MRVSAVRAAGRCVLVVEDEYLLAKRIADEFAKLGVETIGPANTVKRALELVEHCGHLDGAVLDVKVRDDMVFPVADALRARGVPFVFVTGYDQQAIPDRYSDAAHYPKPLDPAQVLRALWVRRGP
jgi:CheY-like chemotaxis protein